MLLNKNLINQQNYEAGTVGTIGSPQKTVNNRQSRANCQQWQSAEKINNWQSAANCQQLAVLSKLIIACEIHSYHS